MEQKPENLKDWVDIKAGQLGGRDIVETVTNLVGNASKFDFQNAVGTIPKLDLPDLENFLKRAASNNGRRLSQNDEGISLITPDEWKKRSDRKEMKNITFSRDITVGNKNEENRIAVGFKIFDRALKQAEEYPDCLCLVKTDSRFKPTAVVKTINRITTENKTISSFIHGIELEKENLNILKDWELLKKINETNFVTKFDFNQDVEAEIGNLSKFKEKVDSLLSENSSLLSNGLEYPESHLISIIWPIGS